MYLKKVLNQPNLVGTVMIVLLFSAGFVYAFAFDGFNVQTVTGGEVEAWLEAAGGSVSGIDGDKCTCGWRECPRSSCIYLNCTPFDCQPGCGTCSCDLFCGNASGILCVSTEGVCDENP